MFLKSVGFNDQGTPGVIRGALIGDWIISLFLRGISLSFPGDAEVFNEIGRVGSLPVSMREGIIHLIYKKGELGNCRLVTLLCADVKVLGKVLVNRASEVIGEVVSEDQTCAVPGRLGVQNVFVVRDILSWGRGFESGPAKGV